METVGDADDVEPLKSRLTQPAAQAIADAIRFLRDSPGGDESAQRFATSLKQLVEALRVRIAEEIAYLGKPFDEPDEAATLLYSRPVYREKLVTNKSRAWRSSSGLWYVYFTLEDRGRVGYADTLAVLTIRHSAARPLSLEDVGNVEEAGADDD